MNNENNFTDFENDFENISDKYNKNRLNISFNIVDINLLTYVLVLLIFSLKAFYLSGKKLPKSNFVGSKK